MSLTSTDLEMTDDGGVDQMVGMRFAGLGVPRGARILEAWVQFQVDEATTVATSLGIRGQASDDASPFTSAQWDLSSRPTTAASVSWSPPAWSVVGEAGAAERTADLSSILQEIVNRPGWSAGSAAVFIVTGTGKRVAESMDGSSAGAPLLHVAYSGGDPSPVDDPPVTDPRTLPRSPTRPATSPPGP
jgi:hypothetical protein